jgi:hypothetical protein
MMISEGALAAPAAGSGRSSVAHAASRIEAIQTALRLFWSLLTAQKHIKTRFLLRWFRNGTPKHRILDFGPPEEQINPDSEPLKSAKLFYMQPFS